MRWSDVPAIVELAGEEEVATRTASIPYPLSRESAEEWMARHLHAEGGREYIFAVERKEDGAFVGAIGLMLPIGEDPAPMGYWLGRAFWNRGYMTEAIRLVVDFVFATFDLDAIRAAAYPDNPASMRVQEKAGMRFVGREMEYAPARGGVDKEVLVREITRQQWLSCRGEAAVRPE